MADLIHQTDSLKIWGHRGKLYKYPGNSTEGIRETLKKYRLETDIYKIKDGLVLYHDDFVPGPNDKELNGEGFFLPAGGKPTAECTLNDLLVKAKFDRAKHEAMLSKQAGEPIHLQYKEEPSIATPVDLITFLKQYPATEVQLEIKRPSETKVYDDGMEEEVIGILKDAGILDQIVIISFNESSLVNTRIASSRIRIGADVYDKQAENPSEAERMKNNIGISYWNPPFRQITSDTLNIFKQIQQSGLKLAPWPWEEKTKELEMKHAQWIIEILNLNDIMSNDPDYLNKLRTENRENK